MLGLSALFEDFEGGVDRKVRKYIDKICGVKCIKNLLIRYMENREKSIDKIGVIGE